MCGYVAPGLTGEQVRAELAERLPEYMLPHVIAPLPALPLTANGKVDKDRLLALAAERHAGAATGGEEPRGPVESAIAAIWAEVLGCPGSVPTTTSSSAEGPRCSPSGWSRCCVRRGGHPCRRPPAGPHGAGPGRAGHHRRAARRSRRDRRTGRRRG
ncbi:hypothetical protein ID875_29190 [Streptomyces globisporus]|uniref:AMP-binding enzyme C-terminal domain-containing protein n=1 Tax=Streptomyces globisporus TaxID=1908 RepID=A0A927GPL1_STRGL|nr:hypothetical protein [Streptomyces globisporus]